MKKQKRDNIVIYMGQVQSLIKAAYQKSGKTYGEINKTTGLAEPVISKVINGKQYASLAMLLRVGRAVDLNPERIAAAWKKDRISEIDAEITQSIETLK